ncbi:MAG TPA: acyl-CoA dehydrogenase family protein [Actinomadura sp.]|nr:acyl-CoA dehydrogenase family protein [Actinomadura sp.]
MPGRCARVRARSSQCGHHTYTTERSTPASNARRDGDKWVLNGEKIFIHNAPVADFAMVLAVTDPARRKRGGMSMFLVDTSLPGVRQAYQEHKMGQRASQVGGFVFEDVRLQAGAILGAEGQGFGAVTERPATMTRRIVVAAFPARADPFRHCGGQSDPGWGLPETQVCTDGRSGAAARGGDMPARARAPPG